MVLSVELAKFDYPLDHPSCSLGLIYRLLDGLVCHHQDGVRLEAGTQLNEATINANAIFLICGYLASAP